MSTSAMRPASPSPNQKTIKVLFSSHVAYDEAARVIFPRVMSVRESEFTVKEGLSATLRIPLGAFEFYVDTVFSEQHDGIRVSANVVGANIDSLAIEQTSVDDLLIDIRHTASAPTEYCTVTCEATGEKRTGIGACIDCPGPRGTVRLCC